MHCPAGKKNLHSQMSWRGMRDVRQVILDPDASRKKLKESLHEVEDKYRNAMVSITHLNNEKRNLRYQVDHLKDVIGEMEEKLLESQIHNKIHLKELHIQQTKLEECVKSIYRRDEFYRPRSIPDTPVIILVLFFVSKKNGIVPENSYYRDTSQRAMTGVIDKASTSQQTGGGGRSEDKQQKDNLKQKDKGSLEQTDAWLQQQVTRYKTEAENAIKAKEQVSMEKRRLQRELRKAMHKMEEMEMKNSQLLNRKEKTKSVTSH